MKRYRSFLIVVSLAFVAFSAVYGTRYAKLRASRRYDYSYSTTNQADRDRERARIDSEQDRIHSIVKPASIAYYLLCLGFFVRARKVSPRRKTAILGAAACAFMTLWSTGLSSALSFDEVYPAWIVAAIVLVVLQVVVLPLGPVEEKAVP